MLKTKQKIIALVVLFSLVATATSSGFTFFYVLDKFKENTQSTLTKDAASYGHEFDKILVGIEVTVDTLSKSVVGIVDKNRLDEPDYFRGLTSQLDAIGEQFSTNTVFATSVYIRFDPKISYGTAGIFLADINQDAILERLTPTDISQYQPTDRERVGWFYEPIQSGKPIWMNPYFNANIKTEMVSYITPLIVNDRAIGVVGVDIDFKQLRDISKRRTEAGKVVLLDRDYRFLVHDLYSMADRLDTIDGGNLKSVREKMESSQFGTASYTLNNEKKVLGFAKLRNGWTVAVAQTEQEAFTDLNRSVIFLILLNVGIMALMSVLAVFMARYLNSLILRNSDLEQEVGTRTLQLKETNDYLEQTVAELESQQAELIILNDHLELVLKQQQEMQERLIVSEKLAALGELVAGVAHELNTPIGNAITLNSFLKAEIEEVRLKFEAGIMSKGDLEQYVTGVTEAIHAIDHTLESMSALVDMFKQMIIDKSMLDIKRTTLIDLFEKTAANFKPQLDAGHHQLTITCDPTIEVITYPTVLQQIISQLISNSLIHGFDGLTEGKISMQIKRNDHRVQLVYTDSGKGISADISAKIFNPFFSTRRHKGSAGLGLHIVYNLVTQTLGGALSLDSNGLQGVTFSILFDELSFEEA